ncbi:NAD(+) diphosphatase [soil metagenome]
MSDHRPVLSRAAHDRAALRRQDGDWLAQPGRRAASLPVTGDYLVPVLHTPDGLRLAWRAARDDEPWVFLGNHGGAAYGMVRAARDSDSYADVEHWLGLREVGAVLSEAEAGLLVEAVALAQWHDRSPFCAQCGQPSEAVEAGWQRRCPDGHQHFPRTDPAVIMLVHDGADRCVLGRQAVWPVGRFSILAGFVEAGESAEAAVAREVAEEVGLVVTDIRYAGSQPWPFPQSLMLGFTALAAGDRTLRVDQDEIAEAHWVSREEITHGAFASALPPSLSIAHRIITDWLSGDLP